MISLLVIYRYIYVPIGTMCSAKKVNETKGLKSSLIRELICPELSSWIGNKNIAK